jgi:hypothetical protein
MDGSIHIHFGCYWICNWSRKLLEISLLDIQTWRSSILLPMGYVLVRYGYPVHDHGACSRSKILKR